ncbi:nuclease-related domain-containing protein [Brevifollis gellanilyticus]|uniref:NERD domain-containing protein n=1 Tax=Brevifollis gellanilyticus TaxID=748831 RepID=A0A512MDI7_9BACT|nr:nuclease-related domain-containing protein [Brevifollis gellanilyticus]GEP44762.1 hypothetical protein BGE01nite_40530 [Brevifollis gellanilyticus]
MKILNELLDLIFNLLERYWMVALPLCFVGFLLAVWVLGRILKGKSASHESGVSRGQARLQRTVPMSLRRLPPEHYKIYNDVYVPRLDNDGNTRLHHVVLSRYGIFVIQDQPENGLISGGLDDREWTLIQEDGRKRFVNPIIRSAYHVKALAKYLDFPEASLFPIIYFDSEPRFEAQRLPYMLTEGLGRYIISHRVEVVSQEELDDVALKFACLTSHRNPEVAQQKHQAARARRLRQTRERAA